MSRSKSAVLFCDGAARGNPGPGAYGFVVFVDGRVLAQDGAQLGHVTNNVAEYYALIHGLKKCKDLRIDSLVVKSDSQLLVRQISGQYRVRNPSLQVLHGEVQTLLAHFFHYEVVHIPREENELADALANRALDS